MTFIPGELEAECEQVLESGNRIIRFEFKGVWEEVLDKAGTIPLPPYIHEKLDDPERYQTVYSKDAGSAAAPTAGLHFTKELLAELKDMGVEIAELTLHVGLGTFRPVKADTIEELAEKLGLPVDNFKATVDRYNELYDKQDDEDFGKEAYRLSALRTAPFEGIRMSGGYFICTMDGIKIDTNINAVDKDGNPIEGLYVAGDCSGGYFDTSYPNLLAGAAAGRSVTFGRLAGKNAARR